MAAQLKVHKVVSALPATLEADSVYYVRVGTGVDTYVTNSSGVIVAYPLNHPSAGTAGTGSGGASVTRRVYAAAKTAATGLSTQAKTNDPHVVLPDLPANTLFRVELCLVHQVSSAGNFEFGFSMPQGMTMDIVNDLDDAAQAPETQADIAGAEIRHTSVVAPLVAQAHYLGFAQTTAAGTVTLVWAQGTAGTYTVSLLAGTHLVLTDVSSA